jgi:hypothetical protein
MLGQVLIDGNRMEISVVTRLLGRGEAVLRWIHFKGGRLLCMKQWRLPRSEWLSVLVAEDSRSDGAPFCI